MAVPKSSNNLFFTFKSDLRICGCTTERNTIIICRTHFFIHLRMKPQLQHFMRNVVKLIFIFEKAICSDHLSLSSKCTPKTKNEFINKSLVETDNRDSYYTFLITTLECRSIITSRETVVY